MATIMGIDSEINEAALIDGASRIKRIFYITIPMLKNTILLLTLLAVGWIFFADFGMIFAFVGDNAALFSTTDVVDTYVFRALRTNINMGMSAAVGFYQSVMGFIIVLVANLVVKKLNPESAIF